MPTQLVVSCYLFFICPIAVIALVRCLYQLARYGDTWDCSNPRW